MNNLNYIVKIAVLGGRKCGKTNFLHRLCYDDYLGYPEETIGIDFFQKVIVRSEKKIKVQFWDTEYSDTNRDSLRQLSLQGSIIVFVLYSITDAFSFDEAEQ